MPTPSPAPCPQCFVVSPLTLPSERIAKLQALALLGADDIRVQVIARHLYQMLSDALGRPPTRLETLQWLMNALHLLCDYVPDPPGEEVFQTVQWTLGGGGGFSVSPITGRQKGCGDCEDLACALVCLCLCLGISARCFWWDQPNSPLNHVSVKAMLDGAEIDLDATIPGARPGESPYEALARVGPDFRSRVFGLTDAMGGLFHPSGAIYRAAGEADGTGGTVRILGMPLAAQVTANGLPVQGTIEAGNTWTGTVPAGLKLFRVAPPGGSSQPVRSGLYVVPDGGNLVIDYRTMPVGVAAIRVQNMPRGGAVAIDGVRTPGRWEDAEMTTWNVPASPGERRVEVFETATATRPTRATVYVLGDGSRGVPYGTVDYATMPAAPPPTVGLLPIAPVLPGASNLLRIEGMPPDGQVVIDDQPVQGRWDDAAHRLWSVPVTPGDRRVTVKRPGQPDRSAIYTLGNTLVTVLYDTMPIVAPPSAPARRLRIEGMPEGATVFFDERAIDGAWEDGSRTTWVVGFVPGPHTLRVRGAPGSGLQDRVQSGILADLPTLTLAYAQMPEVPAAPPPPPPPPPPALPAVLRPAVTIPLQGGIARPPLRPLVINHPALFQGGATPSTPGTNKVHVRLAAATTAPGDADQEVTFIAANGDRIAMKRDTEETPTGVRVTNVWAVDVEPGRYTVIAKDIAGQERRGVVEVRGPVESSMDRIQWVLADQGTVVLTGLPDTSDPVDRFEQTMGNHATYYAELVGMGTVAGRAFGLRPTEGNEQVAYAPPGRYTLNVYLETAVGREIPRRTRVREADVTVRSAETTTVAYRSMVATDALPGPLDQRTGVPGASPTSDSTQPTTLLTIAGVPQGWVTQVDGRAFTPGQSFLRGPHVVTLTEPVRNLVARRPITVDGFEQTIDMGWDVQRALQFAAGLDGITGIGEDGRRVGYVSEDTRALAFLVPEQERRLLREFEPIGTFREFTLYPIFIRGKGMVVVPSTPTEMMKFMSQLVLLRGKPDAQGIYPFELRA